MGQKEIDCFHIISNNNNIGYDDSDGKKNSASDEVERWHTHTHTFGEHTEYNNDAMVQM